MPINYGKKKEKEDSTINKKKSNIAAKLESAVAIENLDATTPIYRGLTLGNSFITQKGFRGMKLDAMWSRYIFESFTKDDSELYAIGLSSVIADRHAIVCGGYNGSPFYIGNFSFNCVQQFETQAKTLQESERHNLNPSLYLSVDEWKIVDDALQKISMYGMSYFDDVTRGDTFFTLAIRRNAFQVAYLLLKDGVDPLIENEKNEDAIIILKGQTIKLVLELREIKNKRLIASQEIILPSEIKVTLTQEQYVLMKLEDMTQLIDELIKSMDARLVKIEKEKTLKIMAELRKEVI